MNTIFTCLGAGFAVVCFPLIFKGWITYEKKLPTFYKCGYWLPLDVGLKILIGGTFLTKWGLLGLGCIIAGIGCYIALQ